MTQSALPLSQTACPVYDYWQNIAIDISEMLLRLLLPDHQALLSKVAAFQDQVLLLFARGV
jgi:hypothetical protein